ncbi:hypothetical protein MERGE_000442 [Pneumocystis wakefieldiae]|uniref:Uncharacterized protein n=1 Tax=Pneumocystis wakefieldiae TaxID=38082 RepID=A0A899FVB6_9ASCO|nr:hypothetical protein MERGE_000442 [Pneumocystis wakefieldiae]
MAPEIKGKKKSSKKNWLKTPFYDLKNPKICADTLDPEDIIDDKCWSDSITSSDETYTGREHYLAVGKRKIRDDDILLEDKKYIGKKTSLKDLYQDSDHISDDEIKYGYFSDKDGQTSSSVAMEEDISRRDLDLSDFSDGIIDEEAEKKRRNELRSFVEDEQK